MEKERSEVGEKGKMGEEERKRGGKDGMKGGREDEGRTGG